MQEGRPDQNDSGKNIFEYCWGIFVKSIHIKSIIQTNIISAIDIEHDKHGGCVIDGSKL